MTVTTIEPVRLSVTVARDPEAAFDLFARRMGEWWPLQTHAIDEANAVGIDLEPHEGGLVIEVTRDGARHQWAQVLVWDPPRRLVLAWKPNDRDQPPTEVDVTFVAVDGGTRVDLEHRGWERLGEHAVAARDGYRSGWPSTLERFAAHAARDAASDSAKAR